MSDIRPAADLVREAFQRVEGANIVEPEALVIWGGIFPAASLGDFLSAWHSLLIERMLWCMVEFVDRFTILRASVNAAALPDSDQQAILICGATAWPRRWSNEKRGAKPSPTCLKGRRSTCSAGASSATPS